MPKHHIAGAAALVLATAPAAWAEIDARTLWTDWQEVAARLGGTLSAGEETYAGGTLTLTDVTMSHGEAGDGDYGTLTLVEQDDGSVRIDLPPEMSVTSRTTTDGTTVEQTVDVASEGLEIVAREEDGLRVYDAGFEQMTLVIGTDAPGEAAQEMGPQETTVTLTGFATTYRSGVGGDADAFDGTTEGETLAISVGGEETGEAFAFDNVLTGLAGTMAGKLGEGPEGMPRGLSDLDLAYEAEITHSGSVLTMRGEGPRGPFSADWTDAAGILTVNLGEEALSYGLAATDSAGTLGIPGVPLPVTLSMAASTFAIALPFGAGEEAKPFALGLELRELTLDDALWGLFDPTGQLPRDPATLVVDLDGTAEMDVDLFGDPAAMAGMQQPPGELRSLAINRILLSLAGAELRGAGLLEFPEDTETPEPVGVIELALDGGFALADRLVALGFIPQEQAAFVKGMTGAVARTVGDDQLESTIEFTPGGGISANGMPVK